MKKAILFCLIFTNSLVVASPPQLEEVVVTAQRKVELLQEVPLSLSVLSEEDLDSRQIETVKQLLTNSPNVIGNNNLATASALSVFIRGVGTTENLATAETSVGVYVDGVYVARQGFNNLALHDVESVEVLRGPQGVLYGRNTNGGAIKINFNKPTFENVMTNNVSYGAVDYIYGDSVINTPINENLAVRFNLSAYQYDGFVTAPYLNRDVNDGDGRSGRLAARYKDDNIDVNLSVDYSKVSTNGNFQVDIGGILTARPPDLFTTLSTFNAQCYIQ
jgi:iron complex outermembrane receptor protein